MSNFSAVLEVVTGREVDMDVADVARMLARHEAREEIAAFCQTVVFDWRSMQQIVVAGIAHDPSAAHPWLEALSAPCLTTTPPSAYEEEYLLGLILGLFEGGVWLDTNWRVKELPYHLNCWTTLVEILQAQGTSEIGSSDLDRVNHQGFSGELANAVKGYIRGGVDHAYRMRQVQDSLDRFARTFKTAPQPCPVANLVFDQLAYAVFGDLSALGRIMALEGAYDRIVEQIMAPHTHTAETEVAPTNAS